jgi:hypothetical protein
MVKPEKVETALPRDRQVIRVLSGCKHSPIVPSTCAARRRAASARAWVGQITTKSSQ